MNLLRSYISNRKQLVLLDGDESEILELFAGVPQGGVLSTLLFIIFIDDISISLNSSISLFADDTSLYKEIENLNDPSIATLQQDLNKIESWAKAWCVEFNPLKSKCLVFCRKNASPLAPRLTFFGFPIECVSHHEYLGVTLDSKLSWARHTDNLIKKTNFILNIMKQYKYLLSRNTLKVIYLLHVKSLINYSDIILSDLNIVQQKKLEAIQYRAMLLVSGCHNGTSESKMLIELGWMTIEMCRDYHRLVFMFKVIHNLVPQYLLQLLPRKKVDITQQNTRYALRPTQYRIPHYLDFEELHGSCQFLNSPMVKVVRDWNKLDQFIKESNHLDQFKRRLLNSFATNKNVCGLSVVIDICHVFTPS